MNAQEACILHSSAETLGLTLDDAAGKLFAIYYEELMTWNARINLVSIKSPQDIWIKHFIDSLTVVPYLTAPAGKLLDIGSGAGFPGIPLKIAVPSLEVSLLEPLRKRVSFLKHVCRRLSLKGIDVIHNRAELSAKEDAYRKVFKTVISRASFKLPELITLSSPFLMDCGILIAMKGNDIADELADAVDAAKTAGLIFCKCHDLMLPKTGDSRKIVIYKRDLQ